MMDVPEHFYRLCRICTKETDGISIYSSEGKENSLEEKIKKFLSIQVSEEDYLPKIVCFLCNSKLESIHQLSITAAKTQVTLMKYLKTEEIDEKNEKNWDNNHSDDSDSSSEKDDVKGSLLHSILTKGQMSYQNSEITELEVTVDPMLFIEEGEEDDNKNQTPDSSSSEQTALLAELKPYQCSICPRGFNSDVSLRSHLWSHLPSRKFLSSANLNRFQIPNAFRPSSKLYNTQCLCQVCGRVYPTRSTLRAHQITHSNIRPHKCSICDKTFKRNQDLKVTSYSILTNIFVFSFILTSIPVKSRIGVRIVRKRSLRPEIVSLTVKECTRNNSRRIKRKLNKNVCAKNVEDVSGFQCRNDQTVSSPFSCCRILVFHTA